MLENVVLAYGGVDNIIITAGIFVSPDKAGRIPDDKWALTYAINATGPYLVADEAKTIWQAQGLRTSLVITTSANAAVAKQGSFAYDTSKAAANHLVRELAIEGRTTKAWQTQGGLFREGRPIDQQSLFKMLRNRIYLGEIQHKGTSYPGQHDAIIDQELWNAAHAFVERRKHGPREGITQHPALLPGLLHAPDGQLMIHSYTPKKNGRLYRYYVTYLHNRRTAGARLAPGTVDSVSLRAAEVCTEHSKSSCGPWDRQCGQVFNESGHEVPHCEPATNRKGAKYDVCDAGAAVYFL